MEGVFCVDAPVEMIHLHNPVTDLNPSSHNEEYPCPMYPRNHLSQSLYPTILMVDRNQCRTHTRTPWGTSEHRLDHRIRYALMVAFSIFFIVVVIVAVIVVFETTNGH
ncbi:hypothetical protein FPOAC2_01650 [Fusarium poae]